MVIVTIIIAINVEFTPYLVIKYMCIFVCFVVYSESVCVILINSSLICMNILYTYGR